jgi:hypothetical protein
MDMTTDAGQAGAADTPAVVHTPPADTPAKLSTTEAARLLASLRKPKQQERAPESAAAPAATAAPELQQESEPVEAGDDAAPPHAEATGETQETDPAPAPTIEPPRSWSAEARERWSRLDPETQSYLLERDRTDSAAVRKAQNEAAEARKAVEAERTSLEQARANYETALPQLLGTLQQQQAGEFADIRTVADVERIAREDWPRYLRWDLAQKKLAAVQQEMASAQQRHAAEQQQRFAEFAKRQDSLLAEKVPDMADPKKAAALQSAALGLLQDLGFEQSELAQAWNVQGDFSLRDHRVQALIIDAVRWREAQAKARQAAVKPVPPVQRPGNAQPRGAVQAATIQNLEQQLGSARGQNAIRLAAQLTAARRAAQR